MTPASAALTGPAPWFALVGAIAALLVIDLAIVRGRGGEMSLRLAAIASVCWVGVALAFGALLLALGEGGAAQAYLAGYLVEKSLSLDNVFVFLLVFTAFAVPVAERHRLLTYGIVLALVLRLAFILAGAAALDAFGWVAFLFAALLIWTGWRMFRHRHEHGGEHDLVARLSRRLPISSAPAAGRLMRREDGRWVATVSGATLVAIAVVDIIFAVDSVPAILAITTDAYVVFAANAFALLGLRPLFFLVAELVQRLYYLKTALAALLIFIGLKLVYGELAGKLGPEVSLPVIAALLGGGVIASLVRDRRARSSASWSTRAASRGAGRAADRVVRSQVVHNPGERHGSVRGIPEPDPSFASDLPLTRKALAFARERHAGQHRRADGADFVLHPMEVAAMLARSHHPDHVVAAAVLHDVLEDTDAERAELEARFGPEVGTLVALVSDDPAIRDEEERKADVRRRVRAAAGYAPVVFAADKVSKVRELRALVATGLAEEEAQVKLRRYRDGLAMLEEAIPGSRIVEILRFELEALEQLPPARPREGERR